MVPNRFVDQGDAPEFNAVDASLWFVVAAWEYLQAAPDSPARVPLERAIRRIVQGYADGTRYGIRADGDGLLLSGEPGVQLTWMDARVGDWVVTPRIGKPVEVQALWLNALRIASGLDAGLTSLLGRGLASFGGRFWNPDRECLYDVVDADRIPGRVDGSIRPNQIFAVGGLPFPLLEGDRARQVFGTVKRLLHTPLGLRSLAPGDGAYVPHYRGGPRERDAAYHQGTVWPWLAGAFGEAWLRVEGNTDAVRAQIRQEVVQPLLAHLGDAGLGHISEIADAEPPHTPRGCPFQAWSLGELIRLVRLLDQGEGARAASRSGRRRKVAGGQPSRSGR
jgi:predicted glycogen debranching enzyme